DPPMALIPSEFSDETVSNLPALMPPDTGEAADSAEEASDFQATNITHRRMQTRLLRDADGEAEGDVAIPKLGQAAAKLCRLAFEMASQPDLTAVCHCALEGLLRSTD